MYLVHTKHATKTVSEASQQSGIGMITLNVENTTGYGRIVRQTNKFRPLLSIKDANDEQRLIKEINTGIYCVSNAKLHQWLKLSIITMFKVNITTDIVAMAVADGLEIASIQP